MDIIGLYFSGISGNVFEDIVLNINKGILITCDSGIVLKDGVSEDFSEYAFSIFNSEVVVSGFNITGYFTGIIIDNVENVSIVGNINSGCENRIDVIDSMGIVIRDNSLMGNDDPINGISVSGSDKVNIGGNNLSNFSTGVFVSESNNTNISNNSILNSTGDGLSLESNNNVSVNDNEIKGSSGSGVSLSDSNNLDIVDNNKIEFNNILNSYYRINIEGFEYKFNKNKIVNSYIGFYINGDQNTLSIIL